MLLRWGAGVSDRVDDILDVTGGRSEDGQACRKGCGGGKSNFRLLLGLDAAAQRSRSDLMAEAVAALADYGDRAANLKAAARFVVERQF